MIVEIHTPGGTNCVLRSQVAAVHEQAFESLKWLHKLPFLSFPPHWKVKIAPPFAGAVIRFFVKTEKLSDDKAVSIYFDGYNQLGFSSCENGYWEAYPIDGDTHRVHFGEEEELLKVIDEQLQRNEKELENVL